MVRHLWLLPPLFVLALLVAYFLSARPLDRLTGGVPPVEHLVIEQVRLDADGFRIRVRSSGEAPVTVAQIQVDGAYRAFTTDSPGPLPRLAAASFHVPYPWVEGETHHLLLVTSIGATYAHEVGVATASPLPTPGLLAGYGLAGLFVGLVPILIGMAFFPAIRAAGEAAMGFVLALTVGLLAFLLVDTLREGLAIAARAAEPLRVGPMVWIVAAATFLLLLAVGRRGGTAPGGAGLAVCVALGIGLHNLGEGLVIGASFATGEVALASFLVLGFALHNVTEGVGIVAPLAAGGARARLLAGLALLAGLPAVFGVWGGALAFSPQWTALCFAIGAGAIAQVVVEVAAYLVRRSGRGLAALLASPTLGGFLAGPAVMYATALLIPG